MKIFHGWQLEEAIANCSKLCTNQHCWFAVALAEVGSLRGVKRCGNLLAYTKQLNKKIATPLSGFAMTQYALLSEFDYKIF